MTLVKVPAGVPLATAMDRMRGPWDRRPSPDGINSAASALVSATATASGTPHTKGGWTEIISATTQDADALLLVMTAGTQQSSVNTSTLLDIGVGGAGSEQVVIPDVQVGYRDGNTIPVTTYTQMGLFPVRIPRGSRVAVRCQSAVASKTAGVGVRLYSQPLDRPSRSPLVTVGLDAANSRGAVLAAPGSTNTKSAWTEITSSVTRPLSGFVVCMGAGGDNTVQNGSGLLDIGLGASGAEQTIAADLWIGASAVEQLRLTDPGVHVAKIPAGSRIAARYALSALGTDLDVHLIGIPA